MILVGISAKAGCGKTTFANLLCEKYEFTRIAISDALKEECSKFTGLPLEYFNVPELKEAVVSCKFGKVVPRKFMQIWGTEFRRAADPNYWIQALWSRVLASKSKRIVVDDVRFVNEADFIRHNAGFLVRLQPYDGYKNAAGDHRSETALDTYSDWHILLMPRYGEIPQAVETFVDWMVSVAPVKGLPL